MHLSMPNPLISVWIVTICGWLVLVAIGLAAVYYIVEGVVRLLGVAGWFSATASQVMANHGWRDDLAPWWLKFLKSVPNPPHKRG